MTDGNPNPGAGAGGNNPGAGAGSGTPPPPPTDMRTFLDEKGTFQPGWAEKLGGDAELAKKYTSLESLVKGHQNLQTILGRKTDIPGDNSAPEEWDKFYQRLGRPEKPDGYGIKKPDDIPSELWDAKRVADFTAVAHKAGLTAKQVQELIGYEAGTMKAMLADQKARSEAAKHNTEESLRKEWGVVYDKKMSGAIRMAEMLDPSLVQDATLANHPGFIKAMAKMAAMVSEGPMAGARNVDPSGAQSARQRLDAIRGNPQDPYFNKSHPNHQMRVMEVTQLMQQIAG